MTRLPAIVVSVLVALLPQLASAQVVTVRATDPATSASTNVGDSVNQAFRINCVIGCATAAKQDTGNGYLSTLAGKDFATSAKQDTGNASLASIDAKLTNPLPVSLASVPAHAVTNAGTFAVQAAQSGTWTVTGAGGTFPVTGTFWQATQPVSGTVTAAQATAANLNATVVQATGSNLHVAVDSAPTTAVTNSNLDIALSALRDAIIGAGPKTLTDVVTALSALTVSISGSVAVTGPLTDTQLRATAVPVSGTFYQATQPVSLASVPSHAVTNAGTFAVQASGTVTANAGSGTFAVSGPVTDTQLRASAVPVDGSGVTQPVSGSVTANLGTLNGAATSAKQDTGNSSLASLDGKAPALGQALAAGSVPVILPAATVTTLTPPAAITGFATSAKQDTLQTAIDAIKVDVDKIPAAPATAANQATANTSLSSIDGKITAVNTGAVVIASSALPSGAATDAKQDTGNTSLASIDTKLTNPLPISGTVTTGGLTDTQLRATAVPISASSLPLPSTAATSTKQSDGSQKTQIVDGSGNVIGATSNALDINIKSGNPTTIAVTQGTATSLKAQAEAYQGGTAVSSSNPLQVTLANTGSNATAVKVDGSAVTQPVSGTFYQATQPGSIADGSDVTLGAKGDAKSTATDTTAITIMSVLKEISAMEQAPASQAVTNAGTFATQSAITAASGSIGAGAIASGAIASGAIASGAVASGAYAAGSITDGAMVTIGLKTDAASTATDTTSTSVVSVLKEISAKAQAPASTPITHANLDVALSTLATSSAQSTGNTSLGTIKTNTDPLVTAGAGGYVRQDSTATIAKESGGNLATIATNTSGLATASNQTTGNASLATLAATVTTDGGSVSASGVQIMGMNLTTGQAQPVAVTRNGALVIQNGTPSLPLPPCNPVRRTFCAPRTF